MARYSVTKTDEVIAGDTHVYRVCAIVDNLGPQWIARGIAVWHDTSDGTCRCTKCSGITSAMLTTCQHARAVQRFIKQRSKAMTQEQQLDLPLPPRVRVRLADEDFPAERSPWESHEYPPIQGWWEVRNRQTSVFLGRWWWDGDSRWNCDMRTALVRSMDMQQFRKQGYEWRGLRDPSPDIYPCPPYSSSVLLPVAQRANVALRTLHAITTPKPRQRVRLEQE